MIRHRSAMIGLSLEALSRNKLGTALGMLGVIVAVAGATAMLAVVQGARDETLGQFALLGLDTVVVRPRLPAHVSVDQPIVPLTPADADRLRAAVPATLDVAPVLNEYLRLSGPAQDIDGTVLSIPPAYQRIMRLAPARGRLLADLDLVQHARVCVLGSAIARQLLGGSDPLMATVEVSGEPCTVVGVLAPRPARGGAGTSLSPPDFDTAVLRPQRQTSAALDRGLTEIWVTVPPDTSLAQTVNAIERAFRQPDREARIEVLAPRELLLQKLRTRRTFDLVLAALALLGLVVGGIGIANVMFAAVVERTAEIGIRRTVGARKVLILGQFLTESTLICVAGGVAGIVLGVVSAALLTRTAGWPTTISGEGILTALAASVVIGVGAGLYPARRAANLAPIDAVRYE